jgi:ABC-type transport system involved in multi-copper enzyme maturation permease subunit
MSSAVLFGVPSVWLAPLGWVAAGVIAELVVLFAVLFLLRLLLPKMTAIAWATGKEAMSQPLFYVVLGVGIFFLILSPFIPYNTFGDDVKMVKEQGLTLILVLSLALALWTASVSVAEEIEGRTALTVLCKPISRWHFVLGKFLGILIPVAIVFIVLGAIFLGSVSYKVAYDARETSRPPPTWEQCADGVIKIVPGLGLAFMEAVVLTSISVAISTRLPMLPNLIICGAIYALGHLVPTLVDTAVGQLAFVQFVADLLATVLPILQYFRVDTAIIKGQTIPLSYLGWAGFYCILYSTVAMLVALLLFEDRDLA